MNRLAEHEKRLLILKKSQEMAEQIAAFEERHPIGTIIGGHLQIMPPAIFGVIGGGLFVFGVIEQLRKIAKTRITCN